MDDGKQRKDNNPIWSKMKAVAYIGGLIAFALGGGYLVNHGFQAHGPTKDWFDLAAGAFLVVLGVSEIRSGEVLTRYVLNKRSEAPFNYWLSVIAVLVVGAVLIVISVGDIFGIAVIERFAH